MPNMPDRENSSRTDLFRERFFRGVSLPMWNDWRWQIKNRITTYARLGEIINLSDEEAFPADACDRPLPLSITPYYASLLQRDDPLQPIRKTVVPTRHELKHSEGELVDPLAEEAFRPVPGIIHRYRNRALLLATDFCTVRCRYCTRSRLVSEETNDHVDKACWDQALCYIKEHPEIRDVLISGGDPLTLSDEKLEWLLWSLRRIPHVEFLRIGTKVPVVLPQRITPDLLQMLKTYHPVWLSIHFTHPDELTREVEAACMGLADAGIPLGSQTVLLRGINDDTNTLKALYHGLLKIRVRPYYLYQCDPIPGSAHFRTDVEKGVEIIKSLAGQTTGYAVPNYVVDTAEGGKLRLFPDGLVGRDGGDMLLRGYDGTVFRYPNKNAAGTEAREKIC